MSDLPEGINADAVGAWMAEHIDTLAPPLTYTLIAGGHSNLTYSVTDTAGGHWVLRRPPLGQVLATAHDMAREHTIISALGPTDVPVPSVVGLCTDESINDAPFYVMDFVDGVVVRDESIASDLTPEQRAIAPLIYQTLLKAKEDSQQYSPEALKNRALAELAASPQLMRQPATSLVVLARGMRSRGNVKGEIEAVTIFLYAGTSSW